MLGPEPMYSAPLLPKLDVPVLRINIPLTPLAPALALDINIVPLEALLPYPLTRDNLPPLCDDDAPPDTNTDPPTPMFPDPTLR